MNNIEAKKQDTQSGFYGYFCKALTSFTPFTFSIAPTKPFLDLHIFCSLPSFGEGPVISQNHYID
jgi:hypothetical protein